MPRLPDEVVEPCPHPLDVVRGVSDWEIIAGRLGDELAECGGEKAVAVGGYDGLSGAVASRR